VTTSGTNTVTVTDGNGCYASASETLTVNPLPVVAITADGPTTFCEGGSVTLTATGGTSYTWSTGDNTASIEVTTGGTKTVTVTNINGCYASASQTVTVNPIPTISQIQGPVDVCNNTISTNIPVTYTVDDVSGLTYSWSIPDGCVILAPLPLPVTTNSITILFPDNFAGGFVTVVAFNECGAIDNSITINPCALPIASPNNSNQVKEVFQANNFNAKVFPNPTTNEFNLNVKSTDKNQVSVRLLDSQGKLMKVMKMMPDETIKFGNEIRPGAYLIEVLQGNKKITQRAIKF
ncbi:MAG: T9SS type A sorting domain-containing protein, partial [Bacteroidota bacterium]